MTARPRSFVAAALVLLVSGTAWAWETRVLTLGDQNRFVEDSANIWIYPQKAITHTDLLILDLNHFWDGDVSYLSEEDAAPFNAHKFSRAVDKQKAVGSSEYDSIGEDAGVLSTVGGGFSWAVTPSWTVGIWTTDFEDPTMLGLLNLAEDLQTSFFDAPACSDPTCDSHSDQDMVHPGNVSVDVNNEIMYQPHPLAKWDTKNEDANRKFDLFTAFRITDSFDLGVHIAWGSTALTRFDSHGGPGSAANMDGTARDNDPQGAIDYLSQQFELGAGASVRFSKDTMLDLGLTYDLRTWDMMADENIYQTVDPVHSIDLQGRLRFRFSKSWWFVPALQFHYDKFHTYVGNQFGDGEILVGSTIGEDPARSHETDVDISRLNFDLGLGAHMRVLDKIDLYSALGFDIDQVSGLSQAQHGENVFTLTSYQLPYIRVGAEAPLWDWFVLRVGFRKNVAWIDQLEEYNQFKADPPHTKAHQEVRERSYTWAPSTGGQSHYAFVGGTARAAGWRFTFQIDPALFFDGPISAKPWLNRFTIAHNF